MGLLNYSLQNDKVKYLTSVLRDQSKQRRGCGIGPITMMYILKQEATGRTVGNKCSCTTAKQHTEIGFLKKLVSQRILIHT